MAERQSQFPAGRSDQSLGFLRKRPLPKGRLLVSSCARKSGQGPQKDGETGGLPTRPPTWRAGMSKSEIARRPKIGRTSLRRILSGPIFPEESLSAATRRSLAL